VRRIIMILVDDSAAAADVWTRCDDDVRRCTTKYDLCHIVALALVNINARYCTRQCDAVATIALVSGEDQVCGG